MMQHVTQSQLVSAALLADRLEVRKSVVVAHSCFIPLLLQWILELDSSTPEKFSRHLLVRVPGWAFPDQHSSGSFCKDSDQQPRCPDLTLPGQSPFCCRRQQARTRWQH